MVTSGGRRGDDGPKAPMVLGTKRRTACCLKRERERETYDTTAEGDTDTRDVGLTGQKDEGVRTDHPPGQEFQRNSPTLLVSGPKFPRLEPN